jgi:hypothetical protein
VSSEAMERLAAVDTDYRPQNLVDYLADRGEKGDE